MEQVAQEAREFPRLPLGGGSRGFGDLLQMLGHLFEFLPDCRHAPDHLVAERGVLLRHFRDELAQEIAVFRPEDGAQVDARLRTQNLLLEQNVHRRGPQPSEWRHRLREVRVTVHIGHHAVVDAQHARENGRHAFRGTCGEATAPLLRFGSYTRGAYRKKVESAFFILSSKRM